MKRISLLLLLSLVITLCFLPLAVDGEEPEVQVVLFWSKACPYCSSSTATSSRRWPSRPGVAFSTLETNGSGLLTRTGCKQDFVGVGSWTDDC